MRIPRYVFTGSLGLLIGLALPAIGGQSQAGFDRLRALAGHWEGKATSGKTVQATYKLVSGGTAVAETLEFPGEPGMLTVYHQDGGALMMTHYCSMGNQPRMRAEAAGDSKTLAFHFVDGTNMAGEGAPHMNDLTIRFDDSDHITQEWTMKGGPAETVLFHLARKK